LIDLAAALVQIDTAGGHEDDALELLIPLLEAAGLEVRLLPWQPGRSNLVATWQGGSDLVLCGHLDTVPHPSGQTGAPPLGQIKDGRLYGRGAADMKGAVAAMVSAACAAAQGGAPPFTLALTSAEETGCEGAKALAGTGTLPADPILIVGEATANRVTLGHKGATWLRVNATGQAAHASAPELGRNAINLLMRGIGTLEEVPASNHLQLGRSTFSVGTIAGGRQVNLVPDQATMDVDIRTVQVDDAARYAAAVEQTVGDGSVSTVLELPSVWTEPSSALSREVFRIVNAKTGAPAAPLAAAFFTDASVLADRHQPRVYILGPGQPAAPHTAGESCSIQAIAQAQDLYLSLILHLDR
jgi:succinyl-diaminopimelate desuccinylase